MEISHITFAPSILLVGQLYCRRLAAVGRVQQLAGGWAPPVGAAAKRQQAISGGGDDDDLPAHLCGLCGHTACVTELQAQAAEKGTPINNVQGPSDHLLCAPSGRRLMELSSRWLTWPGERAR